MLVDDFHFTNKRGKKIHCTCCKYEECNNGTVISLHSYVGNQDLYNSFDVIQMFRREKMNFFGFDLEGHGKSEGVDYEVLTLEDYKEDFRKFIELLKEKDCFNPPVYLLGYSLGGNLAFNIARETEFKVYFTGVILLSPMLAFSKKMYYTALLMEKPFRLMRLIHPRAAVFDVLSNFEALVKDNPKGLKIFQELRKVKNENFISVNSSVNLFELTLRANEKHDNFDLPLILIHGSKDSVTCCEFSKNFVKRISSKIKYFVKFAEEDHLLPVTNMNMLFLFVKKFLKEISAAK